MYLTIPNKSEIILKIVSLASNWRSICLPKLPFSPVNEKFAYRGKIGLDIGTRKFLGILLFKTI